MGGNIYDITLEFLKGIIVLVILITCVAIPLFSVLFEYNDENIPEDSSFRETNEQLEDTAVLGLSLLTPGPLDFVLFILVIIGMIFGVKYYKKTK